MMRTRIKSLSPVITLLALAMAACGPTPPSALAFPTSDGNPNQIQNPNSAEDPNANTNPNSVVASFFASASQDANTLYVVITSDPNFCTNLAAGKIQFGIETQIQVDDVTASRSTYEVAGEAQVTDYPISSCQPEGNQGVSGNVQFNYCSAARGCSGSYNQVRFEDGTTASGNFYAQPCTALAQGLPFNSKSSITCSQ